MISFRAINPTNIPGAHTPVLMTQFNQVGSNTCYATQDPDLDPMIPGERPLMSGGASMVRDAALLDHASQHSLASFVALNNAELHAIRSIDLTRPTSPEQIHLLTDPNRDPDDLAIMIQGTLLERAGFIQFGSVITTHGNEEIRKQRALFARASLDELGSTSVPVAYGSEYEIPEGKGKDHNNFIKTDILASEDSIRNDGFALLVEKLEEADDKSQTLVIIAGQTDSQRLLMERPELAQAKLKHIVIMGGVEEDTIGQDVILPDSRSYNNIANQTAAESTYSKAQELGIPLTILQKEAAYAAPASLDSFAGAEATGHPIGAYFNKVQYNALAGLFNVVIMKNLHGFLNLEWFYTTFNGNVDFAQYDEIMPGKNRVAAIKSAVKEYSDAVSAAETDSDKQVAREGFLSTITDIYGENPFGAAFVGYLETGDFSNVWGIVSKLNQYDPLTLLSAIPRFRNALYSPRLISAEGNSPVYFIGAEEVVDPQKTIAILSALDKLSLRGEFVPHEKARTEKPDSYPERVHVPDDKISWEKSFSSYHPPYYVADVVISFDRTVREGGWADPEDITQVALPTHSYEGAIAYDQNGYPLNPKGRTGMSGRGLLGKWGANYAADPIILRRDPETGTLQMLAIQRKDSGEWAIPGGMVDEGEQITTTLSRELAEEAGVELDMSQADVIFQGYVDDPRNTDNSWMETTASVLMLSDEQAGLLEPNAGDDAADVSWMDLSKENIANLYASHGEFVSMASRLYADTNDSDKAKINAILTGYALEAFNAGKFIFTSHGYIHNLRIDPKTGHVIAEIDALGNFDHCSDMDLGHYDDILENPEAMWARLRDSE